MTPGPLDRYLDLLFDRLSGTGAAGRRLLAEAESHLTESADRLRRSGLDREDAEREAVARFGTPDRIAREALRDSRLPVRTVAGRLVAAAWLLAGTGLVGVGLSGLLNLVVGSVWGPGTIAPDPPGTTYPAARCAQLLQAYPGSAGCRAASVAHHAEELVQRPIAAGIVGLAALLAYAILRRTGRLRGLTTLPHPAVVAAAGATVFAGTGALLLAQGVNAVALGRQWGVGTEFTEGASLTLLAPFFLVPLLGHLRRGPAAGS